MSTSTRANYYKTPSPKLPKGGEAPFIKKRKFFNIYNKRHSEETLTVIATLKKVTTPIARR
jgi:hypothetical protein